MSSRRLLLVSNSTLYGKQYLEHCGKEIKDLLGNERKSVLFIPFALADHEGYASKARLAFESFGYSLHSLHTFEDKVDALHNAEAIFIGGGNTFRLLKSLYDFNILDTIKKRVLEEGIPYIGSSAGSNVACCTIKTTNDMPIVFPPAFDALNLIPFNINAHFIGGKAADKHMGESREQRILQFHEENDVPVVGLPEGAMLLCEEQNITLLGGDAVLFQAKKEREDITKGSLLSHLLNM